VRRRSSVIALFCEIVTRTSGTVKRAKCLRYDDTEAKTVAS